MISDKIVKAFGGTIEVESTEGVGSVFTFRIPLIQNDYIERKEADDE